MTPGRARVLCGAWLAASLLVAQDPAASRPLARPASAPAASRPAPTPEGAAETLLGDRPVARKAAVDWILAHPDVGAPALARALATPPFERFSFDGVRATGSIRDPRVTAALHALLDRSGFRWRPQAFEALADHAAADSLPRFVAASNEPVWRSRAAAARGIGALGAKDHAPLLLSLLEDEEAPVRLEAARALWAFGDARGLPTVVRDLSLDRRFFDADHGALARDAAAKFLNEVCGRDAFPIPHPVHGLSELRGALSKVRAAVGDRGASFPELVPPHDPDVVGMIYAVEARSCVEGDFHLRFDAEGNAVAGRDLLRPLTPGSAAAAILRSSLDGFDYGPRGKKVLGPITCDFERVGVFSGGAWRSAIFGERKRPSELEGFERALFELVKREWGPPAAENHAARARRFGAAP